MSSPRPRRRRPLAAAGAVGLAAVIAGSALPLLNAGASAQEGAAAAVNVTLDPSYQGQQFEGWGTSLVWFANATGGYPDEIRNQLVDMVFGEEGLNLNIARYNIGGGNAPNIDNEYLRGGASAVPGWWAAPEGTTQEDKDWWDPENPEHWNWDADANQRWWIDQIKDDVTHWEAFSNSPPYFQTVSGYVSGGFDANADQIRADSVDEFATYLTQVMEHVEAEHGIQFDTVDPLNEPNTNYWGTQLGADGVQPTGGGQEGAHAGPELQQQVINALAAQLSESELDTVIAAMDETNPGKFTTNWNAYTEESRANVGQMNVHTYGTGQRTSVRDLAKAGDKPLWMSEVGGAWTDGQDYTSMENGLGIATRITDDLRELEPSAWVLWQPIEDKNLGHSWGEIQLPFDCTAEDTLETCKIETNTKYDTIRNFTHYIEPGDYMIGTDNASTVAAIKDSEDAAVAVYTNNSEDAVEVTLDLSKFGSVDSGATVTPVTSSAAGALVEGQSVVVNGATATLTVPAKSVTTFKIDGVSGVSEDAAMVQRHHTYRFDGVQSGKSIAPSEDGTGIVLQTDDASSAAQLWEIDQLTDGYSNREQYAIVNADTGTRLAVADGKAVLEAADGDPSPAAQWFLSTTGDGTYVPVNVGTGLVLDVWGEATADGSPVQTYTPTSASNQRWTLIDETVLGTATVQSYTVPGYTPELPDTVAGIYRDGQRGALPVEWDMPDDSKWNRPGTVTVKGTATDALGNTFRAKAKVSVDTFSKTAPASAKTYPGFTPHLPDTVTAIGSRGTQATVPVVWEEPPAGAFDDYGTVTLGGTATLIDGTELPAQIDVEVTDPIEVNVALEDGVTTSATYTEPGYSTEALRNGNLTDKGWSNWKSGPFNTEDTITVTLPEARDVTRVVSHFWSDGGRNSYADTLQVQYLDSEGNWQNAGDVVDVPTGEAPVIDVAVNAETSAVRVAMTAGSGGTVGWIILSEIEVFAKAPAV
ncbi:MULTISPECIES: RICIN domain-containing protein [Glycomyces]|uniref:O-glycosyl hydrolase n=1 Tax=Glycomyces lechevalierae TaxID=256034 RepID=A0A9X3SYK2_9ACTN|nr:RICIN domain-containing protein [Glycomyces lechevalierae]MDA1388217.1 RICIN domain-containing protein [Glycomyces lechevalierae]MDR7337340.1 O-glycosyl hydrolase [Glycomyces lechevalierae]